MDKNFVLRSLSGVIYALVISCACTPLGSYLLNCIDLYVAQYYLFYGLMSLFMLLCVWECYKIMRFDSILWVLGGLAIIAFVFYRYSSRFFNQYLHFQWNTSEIFGVVLFVLAGITVFKQSQELYQNNAKMIFPFVYLAIPFSMVLSFPSFDKQLNSEFTNEVFFVFILIWSSDTFAFLFGKFFGKHLFAPKISPKKTWEGFIGGFICTLVLGGVIEFYFPELKGNWLVIGAMISFLAPLGDLWESQLKRTFGVKDSSQLIPGHGGFLDRLDSFLVCIPFIYLYLVIEKTGVFI